MTKTQTELFKLTMELDIKTKEYNILCKKLEELEKANIDKKDILYLDLAEKFLKNQKEIKKITENLKKLNEK